MVPKAGGATLVLGRALLWLVILTLVTPETLLGPYVRLLLDTVGRDRKVSQEYTMLYGQLDKVRRHRLNLQNVRSRVVVRPDNRRFIGGRSVSTVDAYRAMSLG